MSDLPVLISTYEPFVIFSLPCPVEEGSDRAALVGTWHPARVNPPHKYISTQLALLSGLILYISFAKVYAKLYIHIMLLKSVLDLINIGFHDVTSHEH